MQHPNKLLVMFVVGVLLGTFLLNAQSDELPRQEKATGQPVRDPAAERPEQKLGEHDWSRLAPPPPALNGQSDAGRVARFEFSRDSLGAGHTPRTLAEVMKPGGGTAGGGGRPAEVAGVTARPGSEARHGHEVGPGHASTRPAEGRDGGRR